MAIIHWESTFVEKCKCFNKFQRLCQWTVPFPAAVRAAAQALAVHWHCPWMVVQALVAIEVDISEPVAITGTLLATKWNPSHASPLQDALPVAPLRNSQATQGSSWIGFILGCCGTDWWWLSCSRKHGNSSTSGHCLRENIHRHQQELEL